MAAPRWPRLAYSAALYGLAPLIGWRIWREQVPTYSRLQRLGLCLEPLPPPPRIWLHCASVGEVRAARPLIEGLLARFPHHSVADHHDRHRRPAGAGADRRAERYRSASSYPPFSSSGFPGAAKRFVARVQPELAILFETELWPNLLYACRRKAVPVAVVNGRLSPRAFSRYQRLRPLMESALANVTWLAAKSSQDAERFQALGCAPSTTSVVGSLKFEQPLPTKALKESECLLQAWDGRPVWVTGSTREGEEALLLSAHRQLLKHFQGAFSACSRHPQRDDVAQLCERDGWEVVAVASNSLSRLPLKCIWATHEASCQCCTVRGAWLTWAAAWYRWVGTTCWNLLRWVSPCCVVRRWRTSAMLPSRSWRPRR